MRSDSRRHCWKIAAISLLLVTLVFIVFGQAIHFGFVNMDDDDYIYKNPTVSKGISLAGIGWAFTHVVSQHWHPLTVIVMMLDCRLFGLWPGGHHLVNVLLHAATVVLLFFMLVEMTGAMWRSAFVAALFAIHPLRAESVAWVSECKDVLSGMFFMLTLWAYVRYTRRPGSKGRYEMILLWFTLGLLSKSMLVTVPCVLVLLDYWPLGRLRTFSQLPGLLLEKLPLFVLSALSGIVAAFALGKGTEHHTVSNYPANAPIAYVFYLGKLVYPVHLALPYLIPTKGWPAWEIFYALLLLAALTTGALLFRRKQPSLLAGWLWYLGMLVPVNGVMQTGDQAYADRYTYLPLIGIYIAVTWTAADWAGRRRYRRAILATFASAILCALLIACRRQVAYWHDAETLWTHTLESAPDNADARTELGVVLALAGRKEEAIAQFRKALQTGPGNGEALADLGNALFEEGRTGEAAAAYREALRFQPESSKAHFNLGFALLLQGRTEEAETELREALRIDPGNAKAHYGLGTALLARGRADDAVLEIRAALQADPGNADFHSNLGFALLKQGHADEAIAEYREAVRVNPAREDTHANLASVLHQEGRLDEAIAEYGAALKINPGNVNSEVSLAWILATAQPTTLRDGARALELAMSADSSTGGANPAILRTLAAAYAQTGDFSTAARTARAALQLAQARSDTVLAASLGREIELYEGGQRYEGAY